MLKTMKAMCSMVLSHWHSLVVCACLSTQILSHMRFAEQEIASTVRTSSTKGPARPRTAVDNDDEWELGNDSGPTLPGPFSYSPFLRM